MLCIYNILEIAYDSQDMSGDEHDEHQIHGNEHLPIVEIVCLELHYLFSCNYHDCLRIEEISIKIITIVSIEEENHDNKIRDKQIERW